MKYDKFGQAVVTEENLVDLLYKDPTVDLTAYQVEDPEIYNQSVAALKLDLPFLTKYQILDQNLEDFDKRNHEQWFMPDSYRQLDIAAWVLDQCHTQAELQRTGQELLAFQERNLFDLLKYLKYLVDTMRDHNIVWGVGRGSSVASFVLYKIGVHKINSLYYDLDIGEFLKEEI